MSFERKRINKPNFKVMQGKSSDGSKKGSRYDYDLIYLCMKPSMVKGMRLTPFLHVEPHKDEGVSLGTIEDFHLVIEERQRIIYLNGSDEPILVPDHVNVKDGIYIWNEDHYMPYRIKGLGKSKEYEVETIPFNEKIATYYHIDLDHLEEKGELVLMRSNRFNEFNTIASIEDLKRVNRHQIRLLEEGLHPKGRLIPETTGGKIFVDEGVFYWDADKHDYVEIEEKEGTYSASYYKVTKDGKTIEKIDEQVHAYWDSSFFDAHEHCERWCKLNGVGTIVYAVNKAGEPIHFGKNDKKEGIISGVLSEGEWKHFEKVWNAKPEKQR